MILYIKILCEDIYLHSHPLVSLSGEVHQVQPVVNKVFQTAVKVSVRLHWPAWVSTYTHLHRENITVNTKKQEAQQRGWPKLVHITPHQILKQSIDLKASDGATSLQVWGRCVLDQIDGTICCKDGEWNGIGLCLMFFLGIVVFIVFTQLYQRWNIWKYLKGT